MKVQHPGAPPYRSKVTTPGTRCWPREHVKSLAGLLTALRAASPMNGVEK
jgi:hypothetical protein